MIIINMLPSSTAQHLFYSSIVCLYVLSVAFCHQHSPAEAIDSHAGPMTTNQNVQNNQIFSGRSQQHKNVISQKSAARAEDIRHKRHVLVDNNQAVHHQQNSEASDQDQQAQLSSSGVETSFHHHEMPQALEALHQAASDNSQHQVQQRGKRTLYACEGKQLEIECQLGEFIQLIRANYGRFSIQICNEHGQLDWEVNCMSSASYQIVTTGCQFKQSCQLLASNEIFGDACPGTPKYLEVHYQCLPSANRTTLEQQMTMVPQVAQTRGQQQQQQQSPQKALIKPQTNNVIQAQQQDQASETTGSFMRSQAARGWQQQSTPGAKTSGQLPPWMLDAVLASTPGSTLASAAQPNSPTAPQCPELVARHIKWPATEQGLVVQMPCPHALAQPSSPADLFAASFACLPGGQWARHVQAARCQSYWLRNLTQRHDAGDSPLSVLGELVQRTRPASVGSQWPASLWPAASSTQPSNALFGDDLVQIARIVRRLVGDELAELLARITDDKQRASFARETIQLLAELVSNLARPELHQEAWLDLEAAPSQARERQRVAGQLVASLEQASVLLAGTLNQQQQSSSNADSPTGGDFLKVAENVYLAIRSVNVPIGQATEFNSTEVSLPTVTSTLGTRWMGTEQRFTLNLQATLQDLAVDFADTAQQTAQLKVVLVMVRSLGAQMEPNAQSQDQQQQQQQVINSRHSSQLVNSDLVSLALVADARKSKVKIDLFAPIVLTFRQQQQLQAASQRCAFWDSGISDWLNDGCKLIASNRTHSTCACNHLTTFALLESSAPAPTATSTGNGAPASDWQTAGELDKTTLRQQRYNSFQALRVPLESVENELELGADAATKTLYLAKFLDGNLFTSSTPSANEHGRPVRSMRPVLHGACLLVALMLALLLAAAAYCRAHSRRLLGSLPSEPPPSLLVASNYNSQPTILQGGISQSDAQQQRHDDQQTNQSNASPPSSYTTTSDYSAALAASHQKLRNELVLASSTASYAESTGNSSAANLAYGPTTDGVNQAMKLTASLYARIGAPLTPSANGNKFDTMSASEIHIPVRLFVHLLTVQLIIMFMVESQSIVQQSRNLVMQATVSGASQQQQQLDPLGLPVWCLVALLYYLIGSFIFWLLAELLRLNGHLMLEQRQVQLRRNLSLVGRARATGSLYGASRTTNTNLYDSTVASSQRLSMPEALQELSVGQSQQPVQHCGSECSKKLAFAGRNQNAVLRFCFGSARFARALEFFGPLATSALLVYLSLGKAQSINQLVYSASLGAQLANWPLALDCAWTLPLTMLLYILPALCALLGFSALMSLRRLVCGQQAGRCEVGHQQRANAKHLPARLPSPPLNPYGNSAVAKLDVQFDAPSGQDGTHWLPMLPGAGAQAGRAQLQQRQPANGREQLEQASKWKRAKFVCFHLLALLALHSICWLAFFAHCRQALSGPGALSAHLMWTFASSHLLMVLLVCWAQRRVLRRACHLAGLAGSLSSCCLSAPSQQSIGDSSPYFIGQQQHQRQQQQQLTQHRADTGTSKQMKVSHAHQHSTSGSLFTIAQARAQYADGSQQRAFYGGAPTALQQQQHLYQQLAASQQHIYDSATNLAAPLSADWHNFQAQQHALTLSRSFQVQQSSQQHFGPAFNQDGRHAATHLATMARAQPPSLQQQQQQHLNLRRRQPGEAEGPLVELTMSISGSSGSSSAASSATSQALPSTTFGPQLQQQQRNASQLTDSMATEHRPFSLQQQQQQQQPINCHAALRDAGFVATSGTARLQSCSDTEQAPPCAAAMDNFRSHSRALPAAGRQQQQQFRQPMMIDGLNKQQPRTQREDEVCSMANNIYDVANYCVS